ncbi:hypothetical protein FG05_35234 [Fusarium graminearum]|nr:hypothetical protein FG05_35234 [Fusarium graminearum]
MAASKYRETRIAVQVSTPTITSGLDEVVKVLAKCLKKRGNIAMPRITCDRPVSNQQT